MSQAISELYSVTFHQLFLSLSTAEVI